MNQAQIDLISYIGPDFDLLPQQASQLAIHQSASTTKAVRVIKIDSSVLVTQAQRINSSDPVTLNLNLVDGVNIWLSSPTVSRLSSTEYIWRSEQPGTKNTITIAVQNEDMVGTIHANGELYQIRPIGGGLQALILVDQTAIPKD